MFFFPKMHLLEKKPLSLPSHLPFKQGNVCLPYSEFIFGALPWGVKASGVPDRGDPHGCLASAGEAVEGPQRVSVEAHWGCFRRATSPWPSASPYLAVLLV